MAIEYNKPRFYLTILIAFGLFFPSCKKDSSSNDLSKNNLPTELYVNLASLKQDLSEFVNHFKSHNFRLNRISWTKGAENFQIFNDKMNSESPFIFAESPNLPKETLVTNFSQSYYYIDQVWINKKFSNQDIPSDVLSLIERFLKGDFDLKNNDKSVNLSWLRAYSSILRLIDSIEDPSQLPSDLTVKYGKMPFERIKSILTKSAYEAIGDKYPKLKNLNKGGSGSVIECSNYWAIAPIMKIKDSYKEDVNNLERLAREVQTLLTTPEESLVGELRPHLFCIEAIEEVLGRFSDPSTGEGVLDAYVRYIANHLWDYPSYGLSCAPFRGVMGSFTNSSDRNEDYCKDNFKSTTDNLYLLYLIKRYGVREDLRVDVNALMRNGYSEAKISEFEAQLESKLAVERE